jgi:hypothetical protein
MDETLIEDAAALVAKHDGTRLLGPDQRRAMAEAALACLAGGGDAGAAALAMLAHDPTCMVPLGQAEATARAIRRSLEEARPAATGNLTPGDPAAMSAEELASAIRAFVETHAKTRADYDPEWDEPEERFNGPDPSCMMAAAEALERGETPGPVFSQWGSGCWAPMGDKAARTLHDALVSAVGRLAPQAGPRF